MSEIGGKMRRRIGKYNAELITETEMFGLPIELARSERLNLSITQGFIILNLNNLCS